MRIALTAYLIFVTGSVIAAPQPTILGSHEGTTRIAISVGGALAASTGDKSIKLWDLKTGKAVRTLPIDGSGVALAFTPDSKAIAVRLENSVDLHDIDSGRRLRRFESHTDGVPRIAISPDGKWLASGGSENMALVWELATGKLTHELAHQYHLVFGVHFSADSKRLITGAGDGVATHGEVTSWETKSGQSVWRYEAKQIWMVTALPDSSAAVSTDVGGAIVFHDWATGAETRRFQTSDQCRALAVSADGKSLVATARNDIEMWSLESGEPASPLQGHQNWVLSLAFAPDSSAVVSGGSDRRVLLWRFP